MMRPVRRLIAFALIALGCGALGSPMPAVALEEADRLWLVGEQAFRDRLFPLSSRTLERLIDRFPSDSRVPEATLLLGKARLSEGVLEPALEAFRQAQRFAPPPGKPDEARFWEGEALYRMKRFQDARAVYDRIVAENAASPMAPDALYGLGWSELELKRREAAAGAFRQLIEAFPEHANAPSAAVYLARTLIDLKRAPETVPLLEPFARKYPDHRLLPEARYLLGHARVLAGQSSAGLADLRAFVAAYPQHELAPQARRALVDALLREGRRPELAEEYRTLVAQSPPTAEGLYDAGVIASRLNRMKDAEAAWVRLRTEFPEHGLAGRASLELAQLAFDRKAFKEAVTLARAATQSAEDSVRAPAFLLVGESELKLKRFGPAHQAFQAAAEFPEQDPAVRYRALAGSGLALEEQKQWAQAAKYYQEVASKSPDATLKAWAKARHTEVVANLKPPPKPPAGSSAPPRKGAEPDKAKP
jgi:TolA-binding protein